MRTVDPAKMIRFLLRLMFCPHRQHQQHSPIGNTVRGVPQPAANVEPRQQQELISSRRPVCWIPGDFPIPGLEFAFGQEPNYGSGSGEEGGVVGWYGSEAYKESLWSKVRRRRLRGKSLRSTIRYMMFEMRRFCDLYNTQLHCWQQEKHQLISNWQVADNEVFRCKEIIKVGKQSLAKLQSENNYYLDGLARFSSEVDKLQQRVKNLEFIKDLLSKQEITVTEMASKLMTKHGELIEERANVQKLLKQKESSEKEIKVLIGNLVY